MYRLYTLGGLRIEGPEGAVGGRVAQRRPLSLLALLAVAGEAGVPRDKVIGMLWPEKDDQRARHCLADTVYALRHVLHEKAVQSTGGTLHLDTTMVWSDVGAFAEAVARGAPAEAVPLYGGAFLDGFHINGAIEFDHWADEERRRLGRQLIAALDHLATEAEERGDSVEAARWLEIALEHEPYDSRLALRLARALAGAGDRGNALHAIHRHEDRLRDDLGLEPDAELVAEEAALQRPPESNAEPAGSTERRWGRGTPLRPWFPLTGALAPPVTLRRRVRVWAAAGLAVATVAVAAVVWNRVNGAVTLDPNRLAIPGFERASGEIDERMAFSIASLLERRLDGAGPLRVVAHTGSHGVLDQRGAQRFARSAEAGMVLFGPVSESGPDSIRLEADLYDASLGALVASFDVTAPAGRPDLLADSLAVQVLVELGRQRPFFSSWKTSSIGTSSSAAALAFINGEWFLSRLQLDSARIYFERAIAEDSNFALAYRGLAESDGWWNHVLGYHPELLLRAGELNRGLAPRESLLLVSDSLMGALHAYGDTAPPRRLLRDLVLTLDDWSQSYPRDGEVWFRLGDAAWHWGGLAPEMLTLDSARTWFSRAIQLDPEYAPQYVHLIESYLLAGEVDSALTVIERLLALEPSGPWAEGPQLIADLIAADEGTRPRVIRHIDSLAALARQALVTQDAPTFSLYLAYYLTRRLVDSAESNAAVADAWAVVEPQSVAQASRGHLRSAYEHLRRSDVEWQISKSGQLMALAYLGAVPTDTVDRLARNWLDERRPRATYHALRWWLERGDSLALIEARALFDSLARERVRPGGYGGRAARGYLELARGDSLAALEHLDNLPRPWCWASHCYHEVLTVARINRALGRYRAAHEGYRRIPDPVDQPPSPELVLIALERAEVSERLGQLEVALRDFEFVAAAWCRADWGLRGFVERARDGSSRLRMELSRRRAPSGLFQ